MYRHIYTDFIYVCFAQYDGLFDWQLLLAMAFFHACPRGSVYVVRLRHMYLLRMEDQGINKNTYTADTHTHLHALYLPVY